MPLGRLWWAGWHPFNDDPREFVNYRLGQTLAVFGDEMWNIRPVQGIPAGLAAHLVVAVMIGILGVDVATSAGINAYAHAMLLLETLPVLVLLGFVWLRPWFGVEGRVLLSVAALVPWYVGGASPEFFYAPDYWRVEYAYSLVTVVWTLVLLRSGRRELSRREAALVGAWAAIGLLTKAPAVAAIGVILAVARPAGWRGGSVAGVAGVTTFALLYFVFALGDIRQAGEMMLFVFGFFGVPDNTTSLDKVVGMFRAWPAYTLLPAALVVAALGALLAGARRPLVVATLVWALPYAYLLLRRPGGTSGTSAALMQVAGIALLVLAIPCRRTRAFACAVALVATVGLGLVEDWRPARAVERWVRSGPEDLAVAPVLDDILRREREIGRHYWVLGTVAHTGMVAAPTIAWRGGIGALEVVIGDGMVPIHQRGGATVARHLAPVSLFNGAERFLEGAECCGLVFVAWNTGIPIGWVEQDGVPPPTYGDIFEQVVPTTPHVVLGEWTYWLRGHHYRVVIARRLPNS